MRSIRNRSPWAILIVVTALIVGCGRSKPPQPAGGAGPATSPDKAPVIGRATPAEITEEEALQFAGSLQRACEQGDQAAFGRLVNWESIVATALEGLGASDKAKSEMMKGALSGIRKPGGAEAALLAEIQRGEYRALRVIDAKDHKKVLFRLKPARGGVNYHEFLLDRDPSGQVRAREFFVYLTGEPMSATLRRGFLPLVAQQSRGVLERLRGSESAYVKNIDKLIAMNQGLVQKQPAETLATYATLPPEVQREKNVLILRMTAAQAVSEEEYTKAMADLRANYPKDAGVDFISTDYFLMKGQFDEALGCVDRLDTAIGGDAYLDVLRANIEIQAHRFDRAQARIESAKDREPDLVDAYLSALELAVAEKDNQAAVRHLEELRKRFQFHFAELSAQPQYADLVGSPEYKAWRRTLGPDEMDGPPPGP